MSQWTNLAANHNGLGSLLNKRETTNIEQQQQKQALSKNLQEQVQGIYIFN